MLTSLPANADLALTFTRISDTQAIPSGSGTLNEFDESGGRRFLSINDSPTANQATSVSLSENTMDIGGKSFPAAFSIGSVLEFEMSDQPANNSTFTGSVTIDLDGGIWADIGNSGTIVWGDDPDAQGT